MKNIIVLAVFMLAFSCQKDPVIPASFYECNVAFVDNSEEHPKKNQFETAMEKVLEKVPGVQIAVRSKDGNLWLGSQGFADIPSNVALENCTKTMVASITKTYVAVLIMQLQDAQILSIDDNISNWLDASLVSKIDNADIITIKQLMGHTSGVRDYLEAEYHVNSLNSNDHKLRPLEKLAYIYDRKALFSPGTKHIYSNSNYVLLQLIIEKARQMPLREAIEQYIAAPLGFVNTVLGTYENPFPKATARAYLAPTRNGNYIDATNFVRAFTATGDGGLATNMQEALLFIEAVFNHGLISEESLNLMISEKTKLEDPRLLGDDNWYGLGFEIAEGPHGLSIGHSGSLSAYWSHLFYFPADHVTIGVAFNGDTENDNAYGELQQLVIDVVDIAFGE